MNKPQLNDWPLFSYEEFRSTGYLLHMGVQAIGKLKLLLPFEPHWANVPLWITSRGLTTGLISHNNLQFSIDLDMIRHEVICHTSNGDQQSFPLTTMSVAEFTHQLFSALEGLKIKVDINPLPQEIPNPIPFPEDTTLRIYQPDLANAWWRILLSTFKVMQRYHAPFDGETPPIGLMWGTFDIRDARYNGQSVPTTGINAGYIRRNAMNEAQIEVGFWAGNEMYPKPAFYSFTYPEPFGIDKAKILPQSARWDETLREFILDYDDLLKTQNPDKSLLDFFESTYQAGSSLAGWEKKLVTSGVPV